MLPPSPPPPCRLMPWDAINLGLWVLLSGFVGMLTAHLAVLVVPRRLREIRRARRSTP